MTLVVYYSRSGKTKRVANDIAARLNAETEEIVPEKNVRGISGLMTLVGDAIKKRSMPIADPAKDPAEYDLVIVGTPVWGGTASTPVITYLQKYKEKLRQVAYFFTAGGAKAETVSTSLETLTGMQPKAVLGYVAAELSRSGQARYEQKLDAFVEALK
jgi:flavodoxin